MKAGTELAGRYRLDFLLGRGGMGEVWQGFDRNLGRRVAVKLVLADGRGDVPLAQMRARFRREAEAAARLGHRNITVVFDRGEHHETDRDGVERVTPFLVLEFLQGRDLAALLDESPEGLPVLDVLEYGAQVCDGLAAAHAAGVVHRDVKPANLMLLPDGTVKVCDFGIARLQDVTGGLTGTKALTGTGMLLGTLAYMAPEQLDGRTADHRADLYGLGASLYRLLTGRLVFPADDLRALVAMHLAKAPDPPGAHRPAIPPDVDEVVVALLAKDPARRPVSAAETAVRLRAALGRIRHRLAEGERVARSVAAPGARAEALAGVAEAAAGLDPERSRALLDEAERVARRVEDPGTRAETLAAVAQAGAGADPGRARALLAEVEDFARSLDDLDGRAQALSVIAGMLEGPDPHRSRALLAELEDLVRTHDDLDGQAESLRAIAEMLTRLDPERSLVLLGEAERIARFIAVPAEKARALGGVAGAVARHDPAEAERIARSLTDPVRRAAAWSRIATATQDPARARSLLAEAGRLALSLTASVGQVRVLTATAATAAGLDPEQARSLFAEAGRLARALPDPADRAEALRGVAEAVTAHDTARARALLAEVEHLARRATTPQDDRTRMLTEVAAVAARDDVAEAERVARSLGDSGSRDRALRRVAEAAAEHDPLGAEHIARSLTDPAARDQTLALVARAAAARR